MKISAVISTNLFNRKYDIRDRINIKIFAVILGGLFSGTLLYILSETNLTNEMESYFLNYFTDFTSKSKAEIFSGFLLTYFPYFILMAVLGTSTAGTVLIPVLSYIKITGMSLLNTYLYSSFGLKGVEYSLLVFFPGKFIMLFSVIFLMQSCIRNSMNIKYTLTGEYTTEKNDTYYPVKIAVSAALFTLSALIDCVLSSSFSSLFSF